MKKYLLAFALMSLCPLSMSAIDYAPWFDKILELEGRLDAEVQWGDGTQTLRNELGLKVTPWTDMRAELEFSLFSSCPYSYGPEAARFSGQYRFLNDIVGDPVSLASGVTLIFPFANAKRSYPLFYPGSTEVEFHLSVGKERILEAGTQTTWIDRFWAAGALGLANERSPWWRTHFEYTRNFFRCGEGSLFARTLMGAGVRSVELGLKGSWLLEGCLYDEGRLNLIYYCRPYAHGLPRISSIKVEYIYTF